MTAKITPQKPFLIMLYGYPGCGKSFFASQFAKEFQNTVYLDNDKISAELTKVASGNRQFADKAIEYIIESYLDNGLSVVIDAPVIKKAERKKLANIALTRKAKPILVWMQMDPDSAFLRTKLRAKANKKRHKKDFSKEYTKQEFQNITNNMQNPQNEDFFVISGKHTYKSQRGAVMSKMSNLKIIDRAEANKNIAKPGLVNLISPSMSGRGGIGRNISIR